MNATIDTAHRILLSLLLPTLALLGCNDRPRVGERLSRTGEEIVACGQYFHVGSPVVLWTDPGGYDAYRTDRRFAPFHQASFDAARGDGLTTPNRYGIRGDTLTQSQLEQIRGGGWDLDTLRRVVDQIVIHYDAKGLSRDCFRTLHDHRGLSSHFLIDIDGTIYQTLDLKERAWHATISNNRSIGIEIANVGAYEVGDDTELKRWYTRDGEGRTRITIPDDKSGDGGGVRTPYFVGRPIRNELITGDIQGKTLRQYDLTPQQYDALIKLTAALCRVFPDIPCDYPRDPDGRVIPRKLTDDHLASFKGLIGHYHIQTNKVDPGPAFQWDYVVDEARRMRR